MTRAELALLVDRPVSAEDVRQALQAPIPADERQDIVDLVRWFTTRYPTGAERLQYARQAYARWSGDRRS
jgi:hypothetical protein